MIVIISVLTLIVAFVDALEVIEDIKHPNNSKIKIVMLITGLTLLTFWIIQCMFNEFLPKQILFFLVLGYMILDEVRLREYRKLKK